MRKLALVTAVALALISNSQLRAQELMANGDFETLEVEGEPPVAVRDAFGNAVPTDWFRSTNSPPGTPLTELIGPENGDSPTDSDGSGSYAAALNVDPTFAAHSDWRSSTFATTPGEELSWSFDFKVNQYVFDPGINAGGTPEGFRIELRSFETADTGGFKGEQTVYVYVHGFGADTNGDGVGDSGGYAVGGSWPHAAASVTTMNFNDHNWHTLSSDIFGDGDAADDNDLWKIPDGGNFSDVRVSVNAFNFILTQQFQLLVDDVSVVRPNSVVPTGDYNGDGTVNAADYTVWRDQFGQAVTAPGEGADGDASGTVDAGDFTFWKSQFGTVVPPGAGALGAAVVPEPASWCLGLSLVGWLVTNRRGRRENV
ncbi:MAG: dockerin type I domain-containing protein [Pirellulales bacterium]